MVIMLWQKFNGKRITAKQIIETNVKQIKV